MSERFEIFCFFSKIPIVGLMRNRPSLAWPLFGRVYNMALTEKNRFQDMENVISPATVNASNNNQGDSPISYNIVRKMLRAGYQRWSRDIVYKRDIPESLGSYSIRQLFSDNIELIASIMKLDRNSNKFGIIVRRFRIGCECYAMIENYISAITWVYRIQYPVEEGKKMLVLRAGEALIADTVIVDKNKQGKCQLIEDVAAYIMKQQGIKPLVLAIPDASNKAVYKIRHIGLLGFSFTRITANPDFSPLSFR
jgi:hypothetical protein